MNAFIPPPVPAKTTVRSGPAIAFDRVLLVLGRTEVLSEVALRAEPGTVHAIVGPNGGGKSSLIRCLRGQAPHAGQSPSSGRASRAG